MASAFKALNLNLAKLYLDFKKGYTILYDCAISLCPWPTDHAWAISYVAALQTAALISYFYNS